MQKYKFNWYFWHASVADLFCFCPAEKTSKFRDPEMGNLIIETHHATDTWEFLKKQISRASIDKKIE